MSQMNNGEEQKSRPTDGPAAASPGSGGAAENAEAETALLEADLKKLQEERDALFSQVARVQADFRNAQRRLETEKQQAIQFANTKLISALFPVVDNFERALEVDPAKTDVQSLLRGMQIVYEQLMKTLKDQQVEVIAPAPGTVFDPNLHQALYQQADERYTEPTITQLLQKGYAVHGRVLRPAQVAVGMAK